MASASPPVRRRRYYRLEIELPDRDEDGISDGRDLCPDDPDAAHSDVNGNGVGDACDPCPRCENVARGRPTDASSTFHNNYRHAHIVDGSYLGRRAVRDYWVPAQRRAGWAEVDLGQRQRICVIRWMNTNNEANWGWSTGAWRLAVFDGGAEEIVDEGNEDSYPMMRWHTTVLDQCVEGDRVRFYADTWNGNGGGLSELEVYAEPAPMPGPGNP